MVEPSTCSAVISTRSAGSRRHRRSARLASTPEPEHGTSSSTLSNIPACNAIEGPQARPGTIIPSRLCRPMVIVCSCSHLPSGMLQG